MWSSSTHVTTRLFWGALALSGLGCPMTHDSFFMSYSIITFVWYHNKIILIYFTFSKNRGKDNDCIVKLSAQVGLRTKLDHIFKNTFICESLNLMSFFVSLLSLIRSVNCDRYVDTKVSTSWWRWCSIKSSYWRQSLLISIEAESKSSWSFKVWYSGSDLYSICNYSLVEVSRRMVALW